jgi:hypothetical protein
VTVEPPAGDLDLFLLTEATQQGECTDTTSGPPPFTTTASFTRRLHAQLRVACDLADRRTRTGAAGGPVVRERYRCPHPLLQFTSSGTAKSVTVGRRTTTHEWAEQVREARFPSDTIEVTVEMDPAGKKLLFAHWDGTDLLTTFEATEVVTSSSGTRTIPDSWAGPFRFHPIGTFERGLSDTAGAIRAPGSDIPMLAFPVVGLPYEFGDGRTYVGGSFNASRQPRSPNSYFRTPRVCRDDAAERFEVRWELRRRPTQ